jgi:type II secretory pathway pseudopilin PulG
MKYRNSRGFTVIELVVVLTTVSVFSNLAITQYQRLTSNARSAGARLALSNAFTLQKAFHANTGSYSACLGEMGFKVDGDAWFASGFGTASDNGNCGPHGNGSCLSSDWHPGTGSAISPCAVSEGSTYFSAAKRANSSLPLPSEGDLPSDLASVSKDTFTFGISGNVSESSSQLFSWTIDQNRQVSEQRVE